MTRKLLLFVRSLFLKTFNSSEERSFTPSFRLICLGMFFVMTFSYGQIVQRGIATTNTTSNNFLTINKPSGVVAGDVMIVNIAQVNSNNSNALSNPSLTGWTLIRGGSLTTSGNPRWGAVLYKIATATEPLTYNFALASDNNGGVGAIVAFSGVDIASTFDVSSPALNTSNASTATASAVTTVSPYATIIMFAQAANSSPTWDNWRTTSPGTLTELYDERINTPANSTVGAAWGNKVTAGSTGNGIVDLSSSQRNGAILVALKPLTYKSSITSVNAGSVTWCPGETRNVTVTITNTGTATWTDGAGGTPDINIGAKWNTNGTSWNDYNVRVDAGNLAPGASRTYTFSIQASNATAGPVYGTNLAAGSNNLTFDLVYEGPFWFASNSNGAGPGNVVFTTPAQTILGAPLNKTVATTSTAVCAGSGTNVTVALSEVGVSYQLRNASNVAIGTAVAGTGGTINLPTGNLAATTTFNVLATSCGNSVQMTTTPTVTVNGSFSSSVGGPYSFCTDNGTTYTTAGNASAGQYALVNVISGFTYTFSVPNAFASFNENILVLDDATNTVLTSVNGTGSGASITGWVSPISGVIKVVLTTPNCANNGTAGTAGSSGITVTQTATGNNLDSQTAAGTNTWIGHIYNAGGAQPAPFTNANYAGYYTIGTENFDENFGSNTSCQPVYSNGTVRASMYTEGFAVRYRMNSTRPAGCYFIKVTGDDGVRLSTDGGATYLFDRWVEQGATTYDYILVNLPANPTFILDYYENAGANRVTFDIIPFDPAANTIVAPATINYCGAGDPAVINGSLQYNSGDANMVNPNISFQWQQQIDGGGFTNISGATSRTYDPIAVTNSTANDIVYQFRRNAINNVSGATCTFNPSNVVTITYSAPTVGGTVSGGTTICSGSTSGLLILSGQKGTVVKWQSSVSPFTAWTDIASTAGLTSYTSGALTASTQFRAVIQNGTCTSANSIATTVTVNPAVGNNIITYTNGTSGILCAQVVEGNNASFTAPAGTYFNTVSFASYGTPTGTTCGSYAINTACHAASSQSVVENALLGNSGTVLIAANNTTFPDPCVGTGKNLYATTYYSQPICAGSLPGAIAGTAPTGNGTYTYLWESSTTSSGSGFAAASGTNNAQNYTPGTLTQSTWFRRTITSGPCVNVSAVVFIKVNPLPTITTAATPAVINAVCVSATAQTTGMVYSATTANPTSYSIDWATLTDQASTAFAFAAGGGTLTGINVPGGTTAGTYPGTMTLTTASGCTVNLNISLVVKPNYVAPTVGTINQPTCVVSTGQIALSGLPASGTLLQDNGTVVSNVVITGTSMTISGLPPGTYKFAIDNGCTITYSSSVTIGAANIWNGTTWSYGADPTINDAVDFRGNFTLDQDVNACSCTVSNSANVVIKSKRTLTVTNGVFVVSGTLTFEDSANLMQTTTSNSLNTGNITYKRNSVDIRQADYVYWSTPVKAQTLGGVSPLTLSDKYLSWENTKWVANPSTSFMTAGKGYIIRGPETFSNTVRTPYTASFIGVPNNGTIAGETAVPSTYYLIGNPYPSALSADDFINANLFLVGTMYFWTHNTPVVLGPSYKYNSDDYATYNLSGGAGTQKAPSGGAAGTNINVPSGYIAAGQSFFMGAKAAGSISFANSMRRAGNNNGQFFKPAGTSKTADLEKNRVWLDMTNEEGAFKQILVGYIEGATN
ncbi:hypothetical protein, partial [Flavobacterium sp. KJJ]|uniref:hypothetical protein n=1 Tax=Flavobacterium sp. KJJ TaxID=1270193 RepID=UPI0012FBEDA1